MLLIYIVVNKVSMHHKRAARWKEPKNSLDRGLKTSDKLVQLARLTKMYCALVEIIYKRVDGAYLA